MTREEFIDKTGVANNTITSLEKMIDKIKEDKLQSVQIYIGLNSKFIFNERVKCFDSKSFIGYGYVKSILADEDYGTIFYEILKEKEMDKSMSEQYFYISQFGVNESDKNYCKLIIKKI